MKREPVSALLAIVYGPDDIEHVFQRRMGDRPWFCLTDDLDEHWYDWAGLHELGDVEAFIPISRLGRPPGSPERRICKYCRRDVPIRTNGEAYKHVTSEGRRCVT